MQKAELNTLDNKYSDKDYKIKITCPEFTCLCPNKPDQPDFATINITYIPNNLLIELKSLKYYIVGYRNKEIYHEEATNKILDDLVDILNPHYIRVKGDWNVRGGITTIVETEFIDENWDGNPSKVSVIEEGTASQVKNP